MATVFFIHPEARPSNLCVNSDGGVHVDEFAAMLASAAGKALREGGMVMVRQHNSKEWLTAYVNPVVIGSVIDD